VCHVVLLSGSVSKPIHLSFKGFFKIFAAGLSLYMACAWIYFVQVLMSCTTKTASEGWPFRERSKLCVRTQDLPILAARLLRRCG
jgi:hypothetical protein